MKLLLDQNLSFRLLEKLEPAFPGSTQVKLVDLDRADDLAVWCYAQQNGFCIVTKDSDFHELSLIYPKPPKIIWLKCGNKPKSYVLDLWIDNRQVIEDFFSDEESTCLEVY